MFDLLPFLSPDALVPAGATLAGVVVGGAITYVTAWRQGRHDTQERRNERRYQQMSTATLRLRLANVEAVRLNYERSSKHTLREQMMAFPFGLLLPWRVPSPYPFLTLVVEAMNAVGAVRDEAPIELWNALADTTTALVESGGSSKSRLEAYQKAAQALISHLEPRTRELVGH